jgi:hypothetical protein
LEQNISNDKNNTDEFELEDDLGMEDDLSLDDLDAETDVNIGSDDSLMIEEYEHSENEDDSDSTKLDIDSDDEGLEDFDLEDEDEIEANELQIDEEGEEEEEVYEEDEDAETKSVVGKLKGLFGKIKRNRKNTSEDEDSEDDDAVGDEKTILAKISNKLPFLSKILDKKNKSDEEGDDESDEDLDDEDDSESSPGKKKFQLKKLHAVIIVVLAFLALNWSEDDDTKNDIKKIKPKVEKIIKKEIVKKAVPVPEEVSDDFEEVPELEIPKLEEPTLEKVKPEEIKPKVSLDDIKIENIKTEIKEEVENDVSEVIKNVKDIVETIDLSEEISNLKEENKAAEKADDVAVSIAPSKEVDTDPPVVEDKLIFHESIVESDISTDITKKLLQDLEVKLKEEKKELQLVEVLKPVTAPSYETIGKGLVYNCKDGHWACIEGEGYKQCRQHYSWNKSQSVPSECYPFAVLDNDLDCAAVQQEKIDAVSDTKFCK